jgi:hypothetical protein
MIPTPPFAGRFAFVRTRWPFLRLATTLARLAWGRAFPDPELTRRRAALDRAERCR